MFKVFMVTLCLSIVSSAYALEFYNQTSKTIMIKKFVLHGAHTIGNNSTEPVILCSEGQVICELLPQSDKVLTKNNVVKEKELLTFISTSLRELKKCGFNEIYGWKISGFVIVCDGKEYEYVLNNNDNNKFTTISDDDYVVTIRTEAGKIVVSRSSSYEII